MASRNEKLFVDPAQILSGADIEDLRTYNDAELDEVLASIVFGTDNLSPDEHSYTLGQYRFTPDPDNLVGGDTYEITYSSVEPFLHERSAVIVKGEKVDPTTRQFELLNWTSSSDGVDSIPFQNDGASTYQIAFRANDYPSSVTADINGTYLFDKWTNGFGEKLTPTAAPTDLAPGLRLKVTSTDLFVAWNQVAETRLAAAWLDDPVTGTTEHIFWGQLESDGVDVYLDTTHYFGQGVPSLVAADYTVFIPGYTISKKIVTDLTTVVTADSIRRYHLLCEYDATAATTDYTVQAVLPVLADLVSATIANKLTGLENAFRSGGYIGDLDYTQAWTHSSNVTYNAGVAPATITFLDCLSGTEDEYIATGTRASTSAGAIGVMTNFMTHGPEAPGYIAQHPHSSATGNYYVIAERAENPLSPGTFQVVLRTIATGVWTQKMARRCLAVCQFGWTTETGPGNNDGVFGAHTQFNLIERRGFIDGRAMSSTQDGVESGILTISEVHLADSDGLQMDFLSRDAAAPTYTSSLFMRLLRSIAGTNELQIHPTASGGSLAVGEQAALQLGGPGDWRLEAINNGGAREVYLKVGNVTMADGKALGGEGAASTKRFSADDLHLRSGKLCHRTIPLLAASGDIGLLTENLALTLIQHGRPFSHNYGLKPYATDGNSVADLLFTSHKFALTNALAINDILKAAFHYEITAEDGNQLDYIRVEIGSSQVPGAGTVIWDSGAIASPAVGDFASVEFDMVVDTVGTAGFLGVVVKTTDNAGVRWIVGPAWRGNLARDGAQALVSVDTTNPIFIITYSKWAVASAAQHVTQTHADIQRTRSDLWGKNPNAGSPDQIWLQNGDNKRIDIPIPIDQAHGHLLVDVRLYAGVSAGGAAEKLVFDLIQYDPATDTPTSLLAAPVSHTSAGAWTTLTCNPANHVIGDGTRYYIQVTSVHTGDGTIPDFWIREAEMTTGMFQMH